MGKNYAVGVDLGGTKIATALVDLDANILERVVAPTRAQAGAGEVLEDIKETVRRVLGTRGVSLDQVVGIGVGSPGPLNPQTGVVLFAPNLGWHNVPVGEIMEKEFGVPVMVENDANLAGLAEARVGAGKGSKNMVYMTVSTGIGGGIIIDGEIYRGSGFVAGEIGHMVILPGGPKCGCGNQGCYEALASGTAIARMARDRVASKAKTSILEHAGGDLDAISAKHVADAAKAGDAVAKEIIEEAATYLGIGMANLINILNPDVIVVGGGVSQMGDMLFVPARNSAMKNALPSSAEGVRIVPAALGGDVGVMGAALLVLEAYRRSGLS